MKTSAMPSGRRRGRLILLVLSLGLAAAASSWWWERRAGDDPEAADVPAAAETRSVRNEGDAADDPAVWIDPGDPERSVIFGTDKKGGLGVYDLAGAELQVLATGRFNNVDLRAGVPFRGSTCVLVAAGEKRHEQIVLFRFDPVARLLEELPRARFNSTVDPEGVCMYRSPMDGEVYVFVSGEHLEVEERFLVEQWRVREHEAIPFELELVRVLPIGTQTEGLVADDETGRLFVAEENVGIWRYGAEPSAGDERLLVDRIGGGGHLFHDVEGLALYETGPGRGYLIASSQGTDDFVVYRRGGGHEYVGRFEIEAFAGIDGVTHTDGIEAVSSPLGSRYPKGIFVAQDDHDESGRQNFKIVSWEAIAGALNVNG